jgi:hypothetical protein
LKGREEERERTKEGNIDVQTRKARKIEKETIK